MHVSLFIMIHNSQCLRIDSALDASAFVDGIGQGRRRGGGGGGAASVFHSQFPPSDARRGPIHISSVTYLILILSQTKGPWPMRLASGWPNGCCFSDL